MKIANPGCRKLTALLSVLCIAWFSGCSEKKNRSNSDLLFDLANAAAELERRGFEVKLLTNGWVSWKRDNWSGMSSPTLDKVEPGESIKTPPVQISR